MQVHYGITSQRRNQSFSLSETAQGQAGVALSTQCAPERGDSISMSFFEASDPYLHLYMQFQTCTAALSWKKE